MEGAFKAVVGLLAVVLLVALLGSERGWILQDRPTVAYLGEIEQPTDFALAEVLDDYGIHLVRPATFGEQLLNAQLLQAGLFWRRPLGSATTPAAGRSIKEFGFLGMPFGWSDYAGNVVYYRDNREFVYAPLNARGLAAIAKANGGDVYADRWFPFWTHAWGWFWVLGIGVATWLWFGIGARRRAEQGLL